MEALKIPNQYSFEKSIHDKLCAASSISLAGGNHCPVLYFEAVSIILKAAEI